MCCDEKLIVIQLHKRQCTLAAASLPEKVKNESLEVSHAELLYFALADQPFKPIRSKFKVFLPPFLLSHLDSKICNATKLLVSHGLLDHCSL